jgi:cephalosporin-C deacetylase-like acetyl esterase
VAPRFCLALLLLTPAARADEPSPYRDVNPAVFPPDDPRAKALPRMLTAHAKRRMQEANLRESRAFAAVTTREQWEAYRDTRIKALRESLGEFPPAPKELRVVVTRTLDGDGYRIHNLVYETRPGLWVSANLYLPTVPPEKMPGVLISHSHHTPKTHGELQDMGMTWARSGVAVLVPDHLGHGERRQHDFRTEKDYPKPFRPTRQDYYFRYNSNLQLSAVGGSLMGWMVSDLMRGVDVLLKQPGIDRDRIILLGAVAGGGDPAGVTAALDSRIACVVPFNFGGWQPESVVTENPDRDFPWFGEGYWESTRGLRGGAKGGFAHYVIVGSVAPRKVIYAHEFAWDPKTDPAWPRLQKVFGFYGAADSLRVVHGSGSVRGAAGPENTHCTHIGAVHRKGIYPALRDWFGMPIPVEYSNRRPAEDLTCWTDEAVRKLRPRTFTEVLWSLADVRGEPVRRRFFAVPPGERRGWLREEWAKRLGDTDPPADPKLIEGRAEEVAGGKLTRYALEVEPGIVVPFLLITPTDAKGKSPVVVMVAQAGKGAFLKDRGDAIAAFLKAGVAVCLVDVRGTGETRPGDGSAARTSSRTSVSQTNLILGQPLLGSQVRDLRTVIRWLQTREHLDGKKLAVWSDSFAPTNPIDREPAAPLDAPDLPAIAEPGAAFLAVFAGLYEDGVKVVYTRGGLTGFDRILGSPYLYVPHDSVVPGGVWGVSLFWLANSLASQAVRAEAHVIAQNRARVEAAALPPAEAAAWVAEQLAK